MAAREGAVTMALAPLVSMKSWRVMASGSAWCSRKVRTKAPPTRGVSTEPS